MTDPEFVVRRDEREEDGSLSARHLAAVEDLLMNRGYVLLPSDTAYSIAARLMSDRTRNDINLVLGRDRLEPLSQAFADAAAVERMIGDNEMAARLFAALTPGPITVVCADDRLPDAYAKRAMASQNGTIGLRVTDSEVERAVAALTGFPVTTVAVRDPDSNTAVRDFDRAMAIVGPGMADIGARWAAIEGDIRHTETSTVVEVMDGGRSWQILRPGAIPVEDIRDVLG